jgi:hypothetical protein
MKVNYKDGTRGYAFAVRMIDPSTAAWRSSLSSATISDRGFCISHGFSNHMEKPAIERMVKISSIEVDCFRDVGISFSQFIVAIHYVTVHAADQDAEGRMLII